MRRLMPTLALACCAFASTLAFAHHGWGAYHATKLVRVQASPTQVAYRNPHAEIRVDRDGQPWTVVLAPTARMESRGLPDGALAVGKPVTVEGYARTDGTKEIRAERIIVDGTTVELR